MAITRRLDREDVGRQQVAREDDAERQALREAHGERVLRVTWQQAIARPSQTVARIRAAGAPTAARASSLSA